ncbi:MAG: hypothetical protein O2931_04475 [Planctomycetota bacterium]|nr:hypothetical protein [Planctomycetota bacterium]MDA1178036.1 hypothetical protein [Planctomycetota bacterium]
MSTPLPIMGHFPESIFPPSAQLRHEYWQQVAAGYQRMRRLRVVIAGLARDVAWILPWTIARINYTGSQAADFRVVIYENDSSDKTLPLLQNWAGADRRVHVISEKRTDPVNPMARCASRAKRMAYYRSQCQSYIRDHLSDFDHVMVVDTDLIGGWSQDGVAQTFSRAEWDFVGANGIIFRRLGLRPNETFQYDAWAYRKDEQYTPWTTRDVNQLRFGRGEPWHAVTSCFGGVGIYRMSAYLAGSYDGDDLEHANLHRSMRANGYRQTFLNPSLLAVYGRKHRKLDRYVRRLQRVANYLPGFRSGSWEFDPEGTDELASGWDVPRVA